MLNSYAKIQIHMMHNVLQQRDASASNGEVGHKPREAEIEQRSIYLRGIGKWISCHNNFYWSVLSMTIELTSTLFTSSENGHVKRRKTGDVRPNEIELEQEEHSLSLSQHSSPSQSDQEQNGAQKLSGSPRGSISALQPFVRLNSNSALRTTGGMSARPLKTDQLLRNIAPQQRHEMQFLTAEPPKQHLRPSGPSLVCLYLFHNTSLCCHDIHVS
jgi:hypothetical protein